MYERISARYATHHARRRRKSTRGRARVTASRRAHVRPPPPPPPRPGGGVRTSRAPVAGRGRGLRPEMSPSRRRDSERSPWKRLVAALPWRAAARSRRGRRTPQRRHRGGGAQATGIIEAGVGVGRGGLTWGAGFPSAGDSVARGCGLVALLR